MTLHEVSNRNTTLPLWRRHRRVAASSLCLVAGLVLGAAQKPASPAVDLDETRAALSKLVETRRILAAEKAEWVVGKELLESRSGLLTSELDGIRQRIDEARASIAETDKKRTELLASNEAEQEAASGLLDAVTALEARTRTLLVGLPAPLVERVQPLSQRLPGADAETKLSLSERFQNVVGILNEVNKFHHEVNLFREQRTLADGSSVEVSTLYFGISAGYYANPAGSIAGKGRSTPTGWVWEADEASGPAIAEAIGIYKNERPAAFVQLPLNLAEASPQE